MAFISSVTAKKANKTSVGIVAKGEVQSVIALNGADRDDVESASSNALAKALGVHGTVMIGDKALKVYLGSPQKCTDLAKAWHDKYNLPFVFAILCYNGKTAQAQKIAKRFAGARIKIPQTILQKYADSRDISKNQILEYLKKISYKIDAKGWMAYRKFIRLSDKL